MDHGDTPSWVVVGRAVPDVVAVLLDPAGEEISREFIREGDLAQWVSDAEASWSPRWVWNDTPQWYAGLLERGIRVARCHDLRLSHAILASAASVPADAAVRLATAWSVAVEARGEGARPALFDWDDAASTTGLPADLPGVLDEFRRQRDAIATSAEPGRMRLLLAAESAGALIAAELRAAGLPWDAAEHDRILTDVLGERGAGGGPPRKLAAAAAQVRDALGDPALSLDSQPKLLRALHRAGVLVESTSRWELARHRHPAIEPLLEYKKLARLQSANGWAWLAEWVAEGRFRPVYVPGGVVTGRWASSGGGALQLPRQLRAAVRADPGWRLIVADVAQLEPRVLAAMAGDLLLAEAARGRDLYAGIVDAGVLPSRAEAKVALLGAMYGATTGDSGRLVPRLRRAFPRAMALVDDAARIGEEGGIVSTWLGRSSPAPSERWRDAQTLAADADATETDESSARRRARDRGRFTRNFIVQGTAAEWALAWLADLRNRLAALPPVAEEDSAPRSGLAFATRPHLSLFLHDEVIVHAPAAHAEAAARAVQEAADAAGRLLFGDFPIDFRLDVHVTDTAAKD
jgi:DNA polymerase-1